MIKRQCVEMLLLILLFCFVAHVNHARANGPNIDSVKITENISCAIIQVKFHKLIRYINHFPKEPCDRLLIQIAPLIFDEQHHKRIPSQEFFRPPPNEIASLIDIKYEDNVAGNSYLSLFFSLPVEFKVKQGIDFRSITIIVSKSGASEPCPIAQ